MEDVNCLNYMIQVVHWEDTDGHIVEEEVVLLGIVVDHSRLGNIGVDNEDDSVEQVLVYFHKEVVDDNHVVGPQEGGHVIHIPSRSTNFLDGSYCLVWIRFFVMRLH